MQRRTVGAVIALTSIAAACSGGGGGDAAETVPLASPASTVASTSVPGTTGAATTAPATTPPAAVSPTAPTTVAPTTPPAAEVPVDAAVATWQGALTNASSGGEPLATVSEVASTTLTNLAGYLPPPLTFSTTATPNADGSVAIEECVLPAGAEAGALLVRGVVSAAGVVDSVDIADAFEGCIPAPVNDAALAAYEDFWNAFTEFTRPPDAASPRLAGTTNGEYFGVLQTLLTRLAGEGKEFRGRPQTRPEVEAYLAPDRIRIGDCQVMPTEFGIYVTATGERTTEWPAIRDGQTDYRSVTMVLVDGVWKVDGVLDETDSPCEYPSSRAAIVVGGA